MGDRDDEMTGRDGEEEDDDQEKCQRQQRRGQDRDHTSGHVCTFSAIAPTIFLFCFLQKSLSLEMSDH